MTIVVIDNFVSQASPAIQKKVLKSRKSIRRSWTKLFIKKYAWYSKKIVSTYYIVATAEASANLARFDGVRFGNRKGETGLKDMYIQTKSQGFGSEVQKIMLGSFVLSSGYYDAYYIKAQK